MLDLFDGLFGSFEGDGLFEAILSFFSHGGESVLGNGISMSGAEFSGARFAGESLLGRLFATGGDILENYLNYKCWQSIGDGNRNSSYRDFRHSWSNMSSGEQANIKSLKQVVEGHSFILKQLEEHQAQEGIAELYTQYQKLGLHLPDESLLKKAYHKLAFLFHTDKNNSIDSKLFQQLNNANEALKDSDKIAAYITELGENPNGIKKLFDELGTINWRKAYENAAQNAHLLEGPKPNYTGIRKWFSELNKGQQIGVVFASIATVGIGTYLLAKAFDKYHKKKLHKELEKGENPHSERIAFNKIQKSLAVNEI